MLLFSIYDSPLLWECWGPVPPCLLEVSLGHETSFDQWNINRSVTSKKYLRVGLSIHSLFPLLLWPVTSTIPVEPSSTAYNPEWRWNLGSFENLRLVTQQYKLPYPQRNKHWYRKQGENAYWRWEHVIPKCLVKNYLPYIGRRSMCLIKLRVALRENAGKQTSECW